MSHKKQKKSVTLKIQQQQIYTGIINIYINCSSSKASWRKMCEAFAVSVNDSKKKY